MAMEWGDEDPEPDIPTTKPQGKPTPAQKVRAVRKLVDDIGSNKVTVITFTEEQAEVLQSWARFLLAAREVGNVGTIVKQIVIWLAGAIVVYGTLRGWLPVGK